jgi:uncharacterized protein (TIGR02687 family)
MDISKVKEELNKYFNGQKSSYQKRKIAIWYDTKQDYAESINDLELDDVEILMFEGNNNFEVKYKVEYKDKEKDFLIYAPIEKPVDSENWLLGIESYAYNFSVDPIDLLIKEYEVDRNMYDVFNKYKTFFNSMERKQRIQNYEHNINNETKLGVAILSALTKIKNSNFEEALRKIYSEGLDEENNKYFVDIRKFGNTGHFWDLVGEYFGYISDDPTLEELIFYLVINFTASNLKVEVPESWSKYKSKSTNSVVFINQWINHKNDSKDFIELTPKVDAALSITDYVEDWEIEDYIECEYSRIFDKRIIRQINENLINKYDNYDQLFKWIDQRKNKLYYEDFKDYYLSLFWAIKFLKEKKDIDKILAENIEKMYYSYTDSYFKLDQYYRKYCYYYDKVESKDTLGELNGSIENIYKNWYLEDLGSNWSKAFEDLSKKTWRIDGVEQQKDFYQKYIVPFVENNERVYVIVSDALRYEVADELKDKIAIEIDGVINLENMQSALPSSTKYGMANLLPNKEITCEGDKVFVDGIDTQGTSNRRKILEKQAKGLSVVIQGDDFKNMTRDELRDLTKGKKLVYIYHNKIDAVGDNSSTEKDVFSACEDAIEEIEAMVRKLKNHITATNIFITADHGFIYRRTNLEEYDKITKELDSSKTKRRYAFGKSDEDYLGIHKIDLGYKGLDDELFVPKGVSVFSKKGPGMNFVHGGIQPQEIIVPVIVIKRKRNNEEFRTKRVDVEVIGGSRKITNKIFKVELYQLDPISDTILPRKFKVYFVNEDGDLISDINDYVADKKENSRISKLRFTLKDKIYKENEKCYLILENEDETVEKIYKKTPFEISLLISDDFDF